MGFKSNYTPLNPPRGELNVRDLKGELRVEGLTGEYKKTKGCYANEFSS